VGDVAIRVEIHDDREPLCAKHVDGAVLGVVWPEHLGVDVDDFTDWTSRTSFAEPLSDCRLADTGAERRRELRHDSWDARPQKPVDERCAAVEHRTPISFE
jgi:hypothetical protein